MPEGFVTRKCSGAPFMPDVVKRQQRGFRVESFDYRTMPAMRFIGREGDDLKDMDVRKALFQTLDALRDHRSGFDYDVLLMHHYGLGVDVGPWHGFWGRFMKADTPVPEGLVCFDFLPCNDGRPGPPFLMRKPEIQERDITDAADFSVFKNCLSGDSDAMHGREGFDSDAMYDVTRNTMLGQGVNIPYPDKYWTAEVFVNGYAQHSTAYMFSAEL